MLWGWEMAVALRNIGWRVAVVPPQLELAARQRIIRLERPDVILQIKCRHPLNHPKYFLGVPTVFVIDDADYVDPDQLEKVVESCRASQIVVAANRATAQWCRAHSDHVEVLWVSHPKPQSRSIVRSSARQPIVAWAHADPFSYTHECELMREVLIGLAARTPYAFWLFGVRDRQWAEEYVAPIKASGVDVRVLGYMRRYADYLQSLHEVAVGLHPICLENPYNQGKSFGKILSYLAADVAVITPPVLDHVLVLKHRVNAMLPETPDQWIDAACTLLTDQPFRQQLTDRAYEDFITHLSTQVVAEKLDRLLRSVVRSDGHDKTKCA